MSCRYGQKRSYIDREDAVQGAEAIRRGVVAHGRDYDTLYPYQCPGEDHWHLSHHVQGTARCVTCFERAAAWFTGKCWVMAAHGCYGSGSIAVQGSGVADEPDHQPAR